MAFRSGLIGEVLTMALDTVRANKLRSGLTVLGVVIGVTSLVGMTSLILGLDSSLRDFIRAIGPETIFVQRFGVSSFTSGREFSDLMKRPNLTVADARAIEAQAPSIEMVDIELGAGGGPPAMERVFYRSGRTRPIPIMGTTENFSAVTFLPLALGRFFSGPEVRFARNVAVLGQTPYQALFPNQDPIGKVVRIGNERFTVIGVFDKRPGGAGFNLGQDDFAVIPYTTYERQFGVRAVLRIRGNEMRPIMIAVVPRQGVPREQALAEVQQVMRIRHALRLDDPDDFDLLTQDAVLKVWDQVSRATLLALVVISSIALMVGGIGVMAIMTISVKERTREIGLRKALGARRREILWQFLAEATVLTLAGGALGIALGSAIGVGVHLATGFPVSLPWWSFALGVGFSAGVGLSFGMFPAVRASRLDPIEALRYE
jgi:putative ABC transport system permease protein